MLERPPVPPHRPDASRGSSTVAGAGARTSKARVGARHPHDVWHVDFSVVPIGVGPWVPWFPFAALQRWPFCWWVPVVLDHASRAVVHAGVFAKQPSAEETVTLLDEGVGIAGRAPRSFVTDRGSQFGEDYRDWCDDRGVRPPVGALRQHGSNPIGERFKRTHKEEPFRKIHVPLRLDAMRAELVAYVNWYNGHRVHRSLGGATSAEMLAGRPAARGRPRFETRLRWPLPRGDPAVERAGAELRLAVEHLDGRKHLPIVSLKRAA
jgi:transposase InsO family protein